MKKIFTTLALFSAVFISFSQSIVLINPLTNNVVSNSIVDVTITPGSSTINQLWINNSTNQSRTYRCRRAILTMAADDSTQFCFGGLCYGFSTNINPSQNDLTVAPHDTIDFVNNGFHCDFIAGTTCVTRLVYYRFEDPANLTDSTYVIFRYNCSSGVNELSNATAAISNPSPNPSSSLVSVNYKIADVSQKAKLILYNVIGKEVKQIPLIEKQGTAKLNTDDLPSGVYFYSLIENDKLISTKKLVISH